MGANQSAEAPEAGADCTKLRCPRPTRASYHRASKKPGRHSYFDPESYLKLRPIMTVKPRLSKMPSMLYKHWRIV
jgi:hypothetical protein